MTVTTGHLSLGVMGPTSLNRSGIRRPRGYSSDTRIAGQLNTLHANTESAVQVFCDDLPPMERI